MPDPGLVLVGVACWFLGCLCFLASGLTHLAHTIRQTRRTRKPQ
ncbi:hypothetical protein [Streptomyces sp. NPDC004721]